MKRDRHPELRLTHDNIMAVYEHEQRHRGGESKAHRLAHVIAGWFGTVSSIVWHIVIFGGWVALNLTAIRFDPFPFVLLTTAVSLESILLSGFVLLSQNKIAAEADRRHSLGLQINLLTERESTVMLRLLDKMAERLGMSEEDRREIRRLSADTDPTDVLDQIVESEGALTKMEGKR